MLAGEPPYTGATAQAIIAKRFRDPVPRVSTLRETVPPAVESALMTVLSKSPSDRFATVEAFVSALNADIASDAPRQPQVDDFRLRCAACSPPRLGSGRMSYPAAGSSPPGTGAPSGRSLWNPTLTPNL